MAKAVSFKFSVGTPDWPNAVTGMWCPDCAKPSAVEFKAPLLTMGGEGVAQVGEIHMVACNDGCGWWRAAR